MTVNRLDFDQINDLTYFANGKLFCNEREVREYFTPENITEIFGECNMNHVALWEIGEKVLNNKWHCDFL